MTFMNDARIAAKWRAEYWMESMPGATPVQLAWRRIGGRHLAITVALFRRERASKPGDAILDVRHRVV
jgi:hypothetical protein